MFPFSITGSGVGKNRAAIDTVSLKLLFNHTEKMIHPIGQSKQARECSHVT